MTQRFRNLFMIYKSETKKVCDDWNRENVKHLEETLERMKEQVNKRSALVVDLEVCIAYEWHH